MAKHPGELSDDLERYIFAKDMQEGHMYRGRNVVGDFKVENGRIMFKGPCSSEWQEVFPHPSSLFMPAGFIRDLEEDLNRAKLHAMLEYVPQQIRDGFVEGYYPRWELVETEDSWTIKISKQGVM